MVRKDGDNKSVDIKDAVREGERANDIMVGRESFEGLLKGFGEDLTRGHIPTDGDPQMDSAGFEGQVRPRARTEGRYDPRVGRGVRGADNTALVFINAEARDGGKGVNEVEGREDGRKRGGSATGVIVSDGIGEKQQSGKVAHSQGGPGSVEKRPEPYQ